MNGIGRRRRLPAAAQAQDHPTMALERDMDRLAADATAGRLAELERIHEAEIARHAQLASDYRALLDALHARSPQEWHEGDRATSALSYLRHLEDEADRCGIDRRPPWVRDARPADEPAFKAAVRDLDAEYLLDTSLPVPPRKSGTESEEVPDGERVGASPQNVVPEAARPPAGEDSVAAAPPPSPEASGTASTEDGEPVKDEPDAEPDCGETGDVA